MEQAHDLLLGYAFIDNDEVVVKQHLLPEPGVKFRFITVF